MELLVEGILSRTRKGAIFSGLVVGMGDVGEGRRIRVRADRDVLRGEPAVGETWRIEGVSEETRWGSQIKASLAERVLPTGKLITGYIAAHAPGIGAERAERLWQAFGLSLSDVLSSEDNIDLIARVIAPERPNLAMRLAAAAVRVWREATAEARLIDWLNRQGITELGLARRIGRILGEHAVAHLSENPYILVPFLPWPKVDSLGLKLLAEAGAALPQDDPRRLTGAVDAAVKQAIAEGHTRIDDASLHRALAALLLTRPHSNEVKAAVAAGLRNGAIIKQDRLWRAPGCAAMEEAVEKRLRQMLAGATASGSAPRDLGRLFAGFESRGHGLHPEQRQAVFRVLQSPLACLQGGAGVGKTHTTRAICDIWEGMGGNLVLCALAGKAALRLSRSTGRLARTLARTLADLAQRAEMEAKLDEEGLTEKQRSMFTKKLASLVEIGPRTLVIVDEGSMVDLSTMHELLRRMPAGSRLLIVGDEAQLPPVGFGLIYHRLVADPAIATRLTVVHRQAASTGIPDAAAAIRHGQMPAWRTYEGLADGVFIAPCEPRALAERVEGVAVELGILRGDVFVVSPTNAGEAGVNALNRRFHERHRATTELIEIKGQLGQWFSAAEPVIYLRNNYHRGLFNGLIGRIDRVSREARALEVLFDGEKEIQRLETADLIDVQLAYAITCHKAQGSQAKRIVVPLYRSRVLDPSWIYTAITRAERQVVLVGNVDILREALGKPWNAERRQVGFQWISPARKPAAEPQPN